MEKWGYWTGNRAPKLRDTKKVIPSKQSTFQVFIANDSPILSPLTHSVQGTNFGKILLPFDQNEGPQSSNDQVSVMSEGGILASDCLWSM